MFLSTGAVCGESGLRPRPYISRELLGQLVILFFPVASHDPEPQTSSISKSILAKLWRWKSYEIVSKRFMCQETTEYELMRVCFRQKIVR